MTRGSTQFGALLSGGYDVASEDGAPLALHLRLSNVGSAPLQYHASDEAGADPIFLAQRFLRDRWRDVELGFCGTGLLLPSVAPGASRDLYLPLPLAPESHRFSIPVMHAADTYPTEVAVVTWDPAGLPPRAGPK